MGRVSYDWVDPARTEIYAANPEDRRELVVFVWYPAKPQPAVEFAPYLPPEWAPPPSFSGSTLRACAHAIPEAAVAADTPRIRCCTACPAVSTPLLLSAIAEELASHGFVVVGVNHTYETTVTAFSDGRIVPMNPAATGGALGPQTGSYEEVSASASVCEYKAADLASIAGQLERLNTDPTQRSGGSTGLGAGCCARAFLRRQRCSRVVPNGPALPGRGQLGRCTVD